MSTKMRAGVIILALVISREAAASTPAIVKEAAQRGIERTVDRFTGDVTASTHAISNAMLTAKDRKGVFVALCADDVCELIFVLAWEEPRYRDEKRIYFLLNGTDRLPLPVTVSVELKEKHVLETITVNVLGKELRRLVAATSTEFRIGIDEYTLSPEAQRALFLAWDLMQPDENSTAPAAAAPEAAAPTTPAEAAADEPAEKVAAKREAKRQIRLPVTAKTEGGEEE